MVQITKNGNKSTEKTIKITHPPTIKQFQKKENNFPQYLSNNIKKLFFFILLAKIDPHFFMYIVYILYITYIICFLS